MNHQILQASTECSVQKMSALLERLQKTSILVLGDLLIDDYIYGRTERVSREAPVPIMVKSKSRSAAGGAANAAAVAARLGGEIHAAGFVGHVSFFHMLLGCIVFYNYIYIYMRRSRALGPCAGPGPWGHGLPA